MQLNLEKEDIRHILTLKERPKVIQMCDRLTVIHYDKIKVAYLNKTFLKFF